ncbi:hypothetical protein MIND_01286000 [Mycena indigotica]|uniref:Uncharacterized protein n=1 Tax=Mycena indigotica TaxID=2126181 RepID=A0A8H6VX49_9AGAR|nr:uncharacterized protein MIND_01286000 [Mycena indigotica]KAF7291414.1 hypothetical protein MIND_01286000 [Mycena indigotica]
MVPNDQTPRVLDISSSIACWQFVEIDAEYERCVLKAFRATAENWLGPLTTLDVLRHVRSMLAEASDTRREFAAHLAIQIAPTVAGGSYYSAMETFMWALQKLSSDASVDPRTQAVAVRGFEVFKALPHSTDLYELLLEQ